VIVMPYNVDVPMERWPIANWALIALTVAVSFACFPMMSMSAPDYQKWMLHGPGVWDSDAGLFANVLVHGDVFHLLGNMIFLFVFGNAVNAKLGHSVYLAMYFGLGAVSSYIYAATAEGPALGASGAVFAVAGLFIVYFPKNNVSVFYLFWIVVFVRAGAWRVSSWVVVGAYFLLDVVSQLLADPSTAGVAYMAHIGGVIAGVLAGCGLLLADRVRATRYEVTLLEVLKIPH